MKYLLIATVLLLSGCKDMMGEYKCFGGVVYLKIGDDAWVVSTRHSRPCVDGNGK